MPVTTLFDNDVYGIDQHRYTLHEVVVGFGLEIWDAERPYPIFDETYRATLNARIYDHFEFRRIATSTPQMFVAFLNRRMREQMPAYNEIYKRLAKEGFDPYLTSELHTAGNNRNESESQGGSEASSHAGSLGRTMTSNTPASFMDDPYDPKYMSALSQTTSDSESSSTSNQRSEGKSAGDYVIDSTGRTGYLGDSILSTLATGFLNTDLMVCDMLEPLFMQFWDDQPL